VDTYWLFEDQWFLNTRSIYIHLGKEVILVMQGTRRDRSRDQSERGELTNILKVPLAHVKTTEVKPERGLN
jgi:hypothetical protein